MIRMAMLMLGLALCVLGLVFHNSDAQIMGQVWLVGSILKED